MNKVIILYKVEEMTSDLYIKARAGWKGRQEMEIKAISGEFAICKVKDVKDIDFTDDFCFVGKTDEEVSLVCSVEKVPTEYIQCDSAWKAFRIVGILDFALTGILAGISAILASEKIGIYAVSTYNTDYILVKSIDFENALNALKETGYIIID